MYHRAKSDLPPEPDARLALRMDEARAAAIAAADRAEALAAAMEAPRPLDSSRPPTDQIAADRAEAALIELNRRLLAAADTLGSLPPPAEPDPGQEADQKAGQSPGQAPGQTTGQAIEPVTARDTAMLTHGRLVAARDLLDTTLTAAKATGLRNSETPAALRAAAVRLREAAAR